MEENPPGGVETPDSKSAETGTNPSNNTQPTLRVVANNKRRPNRQNHSHGTNGAAPAAGQGSRNDDDDDGIAEIWRSKLMLHRNGDVKALLANAAYALRASPAWQNVLAFDEFSQKTILTGPLPWRDHANEKHWLPNDDLRVTEWFQYQGIEVGVETAAQAVELVAHTRKRHPVREYLDGLTWDGVHRLNEFPEQHLGVMVSDDDTREFALYNERRQKGTLAKNAAPVFNPRVYRETVFSKWMISAVARILKPGCQADHCIVLEGEQGKLKSSFLSVLGGEWFTDSLADLQSKDAAIGTAGVWIIEVAELDSFKKGEATSIKAFLTRRRERLRMPYGRRMVEWPRQCVFAGTTNKNDWANDETGARRFWPLTITRIDLGAARDLRDQLWAEARDRYHADEAWWLNSDELTSLAAREQEFRYQNDPWEAKLAEWLANATGEITMSRILSGPLQMSEKDWTRGDTMRVGAAMKRLGYDRRRGGHGDREYRYFPKPTAAMATAPTPRLPIDEDAPF